VCLDCSFVCFCFWIHDLSCSAVDALMYVAYSDLHDMNHHLITELMLRLLKLGLSQLYQLNRTEKDLGQPDVLASTNYLRVV
jgi:hypothetical protein